MRRSEAVIRGAIHDPETAVPVAAERAFLRRLEGGCQVPVAAYARLSRAEPGKPMLRLDGRVIALSGESMAEGTEEAAVRDEAHAEEMGTLLAERLLDDWGRSDTFRGPRRSRSGGDGALRWKES